MTTSTITSTISSTTSSTTTSMNKQPRKRLTKAQVRDFVLWCFDSVRYNELVFWSSGRIVKEYKKDKNITLSPQFVNLQRRSWIQIDGEIRRV